MLLLPLVASSAACVPHCIGTATVGGGSGEELCSSAYVSQVACR